MSANRLAEIRCDICQDAETEWNVSVTWLRNRLKVEGWKITTKQDICAHCAKETAHRG